MISCEVAQSLKGTAAFRNRPVQMATDDANLFVVFQILNEFVGFASSNEYL